MKVKRERKKVISPSISYKVTISSFATGDCVLEKKKMRKKEENFSLELLLQNIITSFHS